MHFPVFSIALNLCGGGVACTLIVTVFPRFHARLPPADEQQQQPSTSINQLQANPFLAFFPSATNGAFKAILVQVVLTAHRSSFQNAGSRRECLPCTTQHLQETTDHYLVSRLHPFLLLADELFRRG